MTVKERVQNPTPKFFIKLRNIGLIMAAISGSLFAAPVAMPAILFKIAGYLAVAGTVAATVSQTVTTENTKDESENKSPDGKQ